ncbi:MAG TPA: ring-cleaving dioxygenase [Longimicrobiales bacterium]|nr:ring-cleaving dioxygenase [Longimicrobiales bacterium]
MGHEETASDDATGMHTGGIHHISAICSEPQRNVDFYTGLLGLRLVKRTVNFDDPGSYHLYYGDGVGSPGTIMTFFAWVLPPMVTSRARQGTGQITATSFLIDAASIDFWVDRLAEAAVDFGTPATRFDETVITLSDPDGLPLEIVGRASAPGRQPWQGGPVPAAHALRGFAGATLCLGGYERTARLLTETMGFREVGRDGARFRFQAGDGQDAAMIDLHCQPECDAGRMGIGAVHHIAWRTPSRQQQEQWREVLAAAGYDVTPVLDRNYFHSIYFREPGGVLFEVATDPPGFTVDEPVGELGSELRLPPWLEHRRERIAARLPVIRYGQEPARPV